MRECEKQREVRREVKEWSKKENVKGRNAQVYDSEDGGRDPWVWGGVFVRCLQNRSVTSAFGYHKTCTLTEKVPLQVGSEAPGESRKFRNLVQRERGLGTLILVRPDKCKFHCRSVLMCYSDPYLFGCMYIRHLDRYRCVIRCCTDPSIVFCTSPVYTNNYNLSVMYKCSDESTSRKIILGM